MKNWIDQLKKNGEKIAQLLPALFIALKDRRTPKSAKVMAALTLTYALSPVDLIPDFIPVLGYLDDLLILPILGAGTIRLIPKEILEESMERAKILWSKGLEAKWYYSLPIIFLWGLLAVLLIF